MLRQSKQPFVCFIVQTYDFSLVVINLISDQVRLKHTCSDTDTSNGPEFMYIIETRHSKPDC